MPETEFKGEGLPVEPEVEEVAAELATEVAEEAVPETEFKGEGLPAEPEVEEIAAGLDSEPVTVDRLAMEPAPLMMDQTAM